MLRLSERDICAKNPPLQNLSRREKQSPIYVNARQRTDTAKTRVLSWAQSTADCPSSLLFLVC